MRQMLKKVIQHQAFRRDTRDSRCTVNTFTRYRIFRPFVVGRWQIFFQQFQCLQSLTVNSGEIVGLLGPNGAGKTTTFYMVVGIVPRDAGNIIIDDAGEQKWAVDSIADCARRFMYN